MQIVETAKFKKLAQLALTAPGTPVTPTEDTQNVHPEKPNKTGLLDMPLWWIQKNIQKLPDDPTQIWPLGEYKNLHGFYCGPGPRRDDSCQRLGDGKPLPKPVDDLDCACMEHDLDYCRAGLGWKEAYGFSITPEASQADKKFINRIRALFKAGKFNWYQRMKATMILGFFTGRQQLPKAPGKALASSDCPSCRRQKSVTSL